MSSNHLPIIDWEQANKVAGQQKNLAIELLQLITKNLTQDLIDIKKAYHAQNYSETLRLVHKLHGALCYTGVPRLKSVVENLETNLKNNIIENLAFLIDALETEVNLLLQHFSLHSMQRLQEPELLVK